MHDVKDIFVEAFDVQNFDGQAPIISQLVNVGDIETNEKLIDWSAKKFENKVVEKVSTTIVEQKFQLQECVQNTTEQIKKVQKLYNILCDV